MHDIELNADPFHFSCFIGFDPSLPPRVGGTHGSVQKGHSGPGLILFFIIFAEERDEEGRDDEIDRMG